MLLATTTVEDVDRFLEIFSTKGAEKRKEHGSKGATVFRDPNQDDRVWVIFDWNPEGWQSFVSDPEVPPIIKEAGHKDVPQAADVQRPIRGLTGPSQIGRRETSMDLGAIAGWASVVLGQLVSWPQVLKLRRERGDGVSLASYAIVNVSMTLFFLHAVAIGDVVSVASVPVSMVPNILIATTLLRRRRLRDTPTDAR